MASVYRSRDLCKYTTGRARQNNMIIQTPSDSVRKTEFVYSDEKQIKFSQTQ